MRGQSLIRMRCRKPSERCASATKPSGAFSLRHEITAAPTLRKRPLDRNHLESSEYMWEVEATFLSIWEGFKVSLQTTQSTRQTAFFGFLNNLQLRLLPLSGRPLSMIGSSDLTSRKATSASYDLYHRNKHECFYLSFIIDNVSLKRKVIKRTGLASKIIKTKAQKAK